MLGHVWQGLVNWVAQNAQLYWTGIGVGFVLWLVVGSVLSSHWQREMEAKFIFGDPPRLKLLIGLPILLFLAAVLLGTSPVLIMGGLAAVGGFIFFLVLATIGAVLFFITLYWMLRRKLIKLDVSNRTWRIERGFEFAPVVEQGSFEDIQHLVLQEVRSWSRIIWRIAVVWKVEKTSYVLYEARHKRPGIMGSILLFSAGLSGLSRKAYQMGWERWVERLQKLEAQLGLPVVHEKNQS